MSMTKQWFEDEADRIASKYGYSWTKNQREVLYNIVTEAFNGRFDSSKAMAAALVINRMNDNKKRVAYVVIGNALETVKPIEDWLKEVLELCS